MNWTKNSFNSPSSILRTSKLHKVLSDIFGQGPGEFRCHNFRFQRCTPRFVCEHRYRMLWNTSQTLKIITVFVRKVRFVIKNRLKLTLDQSVTVILMDLQV